MPAYSPKNLHIFTAAYAGAMAGMAASGRTLSDGRASDYAPQSKVAGAWAQAFDTAYGSTLADELQVELAWELSYAVWQSRTPQFNEAIFQSPSNYVTQCVALVAIMLESETYFAGVGVTPSGWNTGGGGGGGSNVPNAPTTPGYYLLSVPSVGSPAWVIATQNEILSGFAVTLALASGGSGPFELGATWTPTFNANPATNAVTVENCLIKDNLGNSVAASAANPLAAPISGGTYQLSSSGTVSVVVQETQISPLVTANSNQVSASWIPRSFYGVDGVNTATSAVADGNNAELNDSAVLTGLLATIQVGTTFPGLTPSNQYIALLLPHTSTPHTFTSGGFDFPMEVVSTFTFTNQNGINVSMDLYYSTSKLNAEYVIVVTT